MSLASHFLHLHRLPTLAFCPRRTQFHAPSAPASMKHTTPMQEPLLLCLPAELLSKIILQLDHCSIRALLQAFSSLCRHFILIISNEYDGDCGPCFFTSPFLRSVLHTAYDPRRHGALFRLYEAQINVISDGDTSYFQRLLPMVDSLSFVHCFVRGSEIRYELQNGIMEFFRDQWTVKMFRSGVHLEFDGLREPVPVIRPVYGISFAVPSFRNLQSLRIEHCHDITNVNFESLKELTVVFYSLAGNCRPRFAGVTAKDIESFTIHYSDIPPIVENIDFGVSKYGDFSPHYRLSICHIPSMSSSLHSPLAVYPCPIEDLDFSALTSTKQFSSVVIIGGHDHIIRGLQIFLVTYSLTWKQTCLQSDPISASWWDPCYLPRFSYLSFHTLLPNQSLPFTVRQVERLGAFHIIAHNGVDFMSGPVINLTRGTRSVSIHLLDDRYLTAGQRPSTCTLSDADLINGGILNHRDDLSGDSTSFYGLSYLALSGLKRKLEGFGWRRHHRENLSYPRGGVFYYHDVEI